MFDREVLFQHLANKDWKGISNIMFKNQEILDSDPIIKKAIELFEKEFFIDVCSLESKEQLKQFELPGVIIDLQRNSFSNQFINTFIDSKLNALKDTKSDQLLNYSGQNQHRPIAKNILSEIQSKTPEIIANEKRENTTISSGYVGSGKPCTIKLFKSKQERNFFQAMRLVYPTFHSYPNVSLSCIFDYKEIESQLNGKEKGYFFKAIIDNVVFDSDDDYEPLFFFELDSLYHDTEDMIEKDRMKDNIFKYANTKLIRIRAHNKKDMSVSSFKDLIIDVTRSN